MSIALQEMIFCPKAWCTPPHLPERRALFAFERALPCNLATEKRLDDAHAIADAVEERLKKDLELEEVTVHVEPC